MPPRVSNTTTQAMVVIAVVGAVAAGAIALVGYPSERAVVVARNPQPKPLTPAVHVAAPAQNEELVAAAAPRTAVEKPRQTRATTTRSLPRDSRPSWPPSAAVSAVAGRVNRGTVAPAPTTNAAAVASTTSLDPATQPITISGCLEMTVDAEQFRLTETEGADAPKSRGWRSGFLAKRSAPVQLAELSDPAGLRQYVGHRVVVTGLLTDRKLRVRSFQAADTACD